MQRKLLTTALILLGTTLAQSHEFWLQPRKFRYAVGETMKVDFMVGENFTGEFWDLQRHKVEKLEFHSVAQPKNLLNEVKNSKGSNLSYTFEREGTDVLVLESNFAYIGLEGEKFNAYLKEDGLDYILDSRTKDGKLNEPSRENYKRYAKLIVQVGNKFDDTFRKKIGLRYEIIPLANPYAMKSGDYLECQVFWEGKPAPHALVKVWNFVGHRSFLQNIYSEDDGTIKFPISSPGPWMVSSVRMIPSEKDGADYQSLWTSLVFGIE